MDKRNYELVFLISPDLNQQELEDFFKKIESLIANMGNIIKSEKPNKIALKYAIQKKKEAFLSWFEFEAEIDKIKEFKQQIEKENNILRFLMIKKVEKVKPIKHEPK